MAISIGVVKKAWEIRKKATISMKDLAEHFGVDEKELAEVMEQIARQESNLYKDIED